MKQMKHLMANRVRLALVIPILLLVAIAAYAVTPAPATCCFAVLGDSHDNTEMFAKLLKLISQDPSHPQLLFHLGDIVNSGCNKKAWKRYGETISILQNKIPVYAIPGNHDARFDGKLKNFVKYAQPPDGRTYYSFKYCNAGFVCLNTYEKGHSGVIGPEQMEWLKATLEQLKSEVKVTFAFVHQPLRKREGGYRNKKLLENADEVKKLFKDNGVAAVFMGHVHLFRYYEEDGIHYVFTAGAGGKLYGQSAGALFHYCRVTMTPDLITILVIDQEGNESRPINIPLTLTNQQPDGRGV